VKRYRAILGPVVAVALFLIGMRWSPFEPHREPAAETAPASTWNDDDWRVLETAVQRALTTRADTLPFGDLMADIGRSLVGTAYVPRTLEVDGPERLVVNLRGLDCVTFVENVFAIATLVKADVRTSMTDRASIERYYEGTLTSLRYRDGVIDGYGSRLHYFTDWIRDNEAKRLVRDVTAELGGVVDREPIDFMSTHTDAYRQLSDVGNVARVEEAESRLTTDGRHFIPEDEIARVADRIHNGDIIAATSTVGGLDVAHTGLALWVDGTLRMLHAPLVGEAVQISEVTLAERIIRIEGQDGIIVARPVKR
jgi:hypothetical protein